jgi:hypothetical protein
MRPEGVDGNSHMIKGCHGKSTANLPNGELVK